MREERECPHCAEMILGRAKVCKHCGREVIPSSAADEDPSEAVRDPIPLSAAPRPLGGILLAVFVALLVVGAVGTFRLHWFNKSAVTTSAIATSSVAVAQSPPQQARQSILQDPTAIPTELLNGRFEEVGPAGTADTMTFINGWWTLIPPDSIVINPKDSVAGKQKMQALLMKMYTDSMARLTGVSLTGEPIDPSPPFELVERNSLNPNGTLTIARRHGIGVRSGTCQLMTTGKPNEWSCLLSASSVAARTLITKGIVAISFARDADGFLMPAQPATSMIAWRLNRLP
jgi:hypothetical protein